VIIYASIPSVDIRAGRCGIVGQGGEGARSGVAYGLRMGEQTIVVSVGDDQ
jgi:hypothetical protein